jgi:signal transduction histidine kinase
VLRAGMSTDGKTADVEREKTDESLRAEREKADRALAAKNATIEEDADEVVQRAREHADAVLLAARVKADQQLDDSSAHVEPRAVIAKERLIEDDTLRDERASADESLRREREEGARALASLLPLERDQTDRYLLTERARSDDAVANRDDFLGIVSHDLRNLLGGIVMSAGVLSGRATDSSEGAQTLAQTSRIQRYAARMNRLIGDLLDVASIDSGQLGMSPSSGDASALLTEAVDMFQAAALAQGVSVQAEVAESPLLADFDHDRMLQVLGNLLSNSIKFSAQGGKVLVRGERFRSGLRFCVSDTGSGIPPELLVAIFERFWQVDKYDRRGVGLGLYISRCIVEAHAGRIWAESQLGEGTRIYFTLPLSAAPPSAVPPVRVPL